MRKTITEEEPVATVEEDAKTIKALLETQPKVRVKINLTDRHDEFVPVCINGYRVDVPVGKTVEVPEQVAELLENAGYI